MTLIPDIDFDKPRQSTLDDDIFTFSYVNNTQMLSVDLSLFTGKWFDYRHMTPLQATAHYIACFGVIYKQMFGANVDRERVEHVRVDTLESLKETIDKGDKKRAAAAKKRLSGYWRGRQVADALGMPYEVYIDLAIGFRLRYWDQRHLPRPDQLYDNRDIDRISDRWEEIQASRLYLAQHPTYLVHNYIGAAHQNDYHEWLFGQAEKRNYKERMLADFVNNYALPLNKVQSRLPADEAERFEAYLH